MRGRRGANECKTQFTSVAPAVVAAGEHWVPLLLRRTAKGIATEEIRSVMSAVRASSPDVRVDDEIMYVLVAIAFLLHGYALQ